MSNQEPNDSYYCLKYLSALIFDTEEKTYEESDLIKRIDVIKCLKDLVEAYVEKSCFSSKIRKNIYSMLSFLREIYDEDREERISLINQIIRILNRQTEDHSLFFYAIQLSIRKNDKKYLTKYPDSYIIEEIDQVNNSIVEDFIVLSMLSSNATSDENFKFDIEEFLGDSSFYGNVNVILSEKPSLLKNKIFCERIKYVLEYNKKVDRKYKKLNKNLLRKINNKIV